MSIVNSLAKRGLRADDRKNLKWGPFFMKYVTFPSIVFGIATFIVCAFIINSESGMPINSMIAAAMAGFLAFGSYVIIRMVHLSLKK